MKMEGVTVVSRESDGNRVVRMLVHYLRPQNAELITVELIKDPQVRGLFNGRRPQKSEHPESTYEYWESGLRGNRFYANIIPGDGPTDGFLFHDLMIPETYRTQIPRG